MKAILASLVSVYATTVAAGPYTLIYYTEKNCSGRSYQCGEQDANVCCYAPRDPYYVYVPSTKVTSSGAGGRVAFTQADKNGHCSSYMSSGDLNVCHDISKEFTPIYVMSNNNRFAASGTAIKCSKSVAPDVLTVGGQKYSVKDGKKDAILADFASLKDDATFAAKWSELAI